METLKKVGAVVGAAVVVGSLGLAGHNTSKASNLAEDLAELQSKISSGELVPADSIDLTVDNQAAIDEALKNVDLTQDNDAAIREAMQQLAEENEALEFDEESGKVVLASPAVTGESVENLENAFTLNDVSFGDSFNVEIDSDDLVKLFSGDVSFDDDDIEVEEVVKLMDGAKIAFSGSSEFSKSLGALPQLVMLNRNSLVHGFEIKDELDLDKISVDKPLKLPFLNGEELKIVELGDDSMVIQAGKEFLLEAGESVDVEGKSVKLVLVGDDSIAVEVDGKKVLVDKDSDSEVEGLKVLVLDTFRSDNPREGMANLLIGKDTYKEVSNGDGFDNDDSSEADWVWMVSPEFIGVKYNKILNEDGEALKPGDKLVTPGGVSVSIVHKEESKIGLDLDFDEVEIDEVLEPVLRLQLSGDKFEFTMDDKEERSDKLYFDCSSFYALDDNELKVVSEISIRKTGDIVDSDLVLHGVDIDVNCVDQEFSKLELNGLDLSNRDEDTLGDDGLVVKAVSDLEDADEVSLLIPKEQEKVDLVFS